MRPYENSLIWKNDERKGAMKATVDRVTCISCGLCVSICPNVFEMDDEDIAIVKVDTLDVQDEEDAREAADQCPVSAIEIIED
jgi:ferredoxin